MTDTSHLMDLTLWLTYRSWKLCNTRSSVTRAGVRKMPIQDRGLGLGDRLRTIATTPPGIEISTPREIMVTFPHPPLFPHDGYCLGVDVKPSTLLSWGTHASPPWGSCSHSSLTSAHEVRFSPLPRTCFAPRLAFCTVGKLLASFTVGVTVPDSRSK